MKYLVMTALLLTALVVTGSDAWAPTTVPIVDDDLIWCVPAGPDTFIAHLMQPEALPPGDVLGGFTAAEVVQTIAAKGPGAWIHFVGDGRPHGALPMILMQEGFTAEGITDPEWEWN
ncbi:MAG: hypothetical protein ACYTG6_03740 [Planctomycetota bacterium]|jgi:hypothetical protein